MIELLKEGIDKLGIKASAEQLNQIESYISEIELFNPVYKLVSYEEEAELVIRHILDCLAGLPIIDKELGKEGRLADLGSGAGLPGILLAIMLPEHQIYLVERMARRVAFLKNVILRCNLKNVTVLSIDVKELKDEFEVVTCRAFHPLYDIAGDVERLLTKGGALCAYKAQRAYVEAELDQVKGFTSKLIPLKVPFLDEMRIMCVLRRCDG